VYYLKCLDSKKNKIDVVNCVSWMHGFQTSLF
jgi:hypothetical protein